MDEAELDLHMSLLAEEIVEVSIWNGLRTD